MFCFENQARRDKVTLTECRVDDCARVCMESDDCQSFTFEKGTCKLQGSFVDSDMVYCTKRLAQEADKELASFVLVPSESRRRRRHGRSAWASKERLVQVALRAPTTAVGERQYRDHDERTGDEEERALHAGGTAQKKAHSPFLFF